jgi:diguanylate cyclase (GGDEF)-like protein
MTTKNNNAVSQLQDALTMLKELDRALSMHLQWLKELHRALICDEPPKPADISPDAHRVCCFGKWYYELPKASREEEPALDGMEGPHQKMHDAARSLLLAHRQGLPIAPQDYETFMDLALDFKMAILNCQNHIIARVCTVDHLTGAWNRHAMSMRLNEELERARRSRTSCCICLLDLDHFKRINDTHGHGVGDTVLQTVSRFLKDKIRPYDSFFRYGGEEFLICLPDTSLENAAALLNRLRDDLAALPVPTKNSVPLRVTASFGVAPMALEADLENSLERADHALLCAKAKGRNQVCSWDLDSELPVCPA